MTPPEGFSPHFRKSALTDAWEPLYSRIEDRAVIIGLYASEKHCNSRGLVHGGLIAALADNAMGLSCHRALQSDDQPTSGLVTISLNLDYMGAAKLDRWLAFATDFVKTGKSICFARALVTSGDNVVARASATFKASR